MPYTDVHQVDRGDLLAPSHVHLHLLPAGLRHATQAAALDDPIRRLASVA